MHVPSKEESELVARIGLCVVCTPFVITAIVLMAFISALFNPAASPDAKNAGTIGAVILFTLIVVAAGCGTYRVRASRRKAQAAQRLTEKSELI